MLDHPSLAERLPNGLIGVNDDYRHRVLLIDPVTNSDRLAIRTDRHARHRARSAQYPRWIRPAPPRQHHSIAPDHRVTSMTDPTVPDVGTSVEPERPGANRVEVVAPRLEIRRRARRMLMVALLVALAVVGWSLGSALVRGSDPASVKFVEWVRGHGGGGIVNVIERTWYEHHQPAKGGTPKGGIPKVAAPDRHRTGAVNHHRSHTDNGSVFAAADPTDRESCARGRRRVATHRPTRSRPSRGVRDVPAARQSPHQLARGCRLARPARVRAVIYNGNNQPGGSGWLHGDHVLPSETPGLVAAFNGGFRLDMSQGGYESEGRVDPSLRHRPRHVRCTRQRWSRPRGLGPRSLPDHSLCVRVPEPRPHRRRRQRRARPLARRSPPMGRDPRRARVRLALRCRDRRPRQPCLRRGRARHREPRRRATRGGCCARDGTRHQLVLGEFRHVPSRRERPCSRRSCCPTWNAARTATSYPAPGTS